jgi:hypothetical protein
MSKQYPLGYGKIRKPAARAMSRADLRIKSLKVSPRFPVMRPTSRASAWLDEGTVHH